MKNVVFLLSSMFISVTLMSARCGGESSTTSNQYIYKQYTPLISVSSSVSDDGRNCEKTANIDVDNNGVVDAFAFSYSCTGLVTGLLDASHTRLTGLYVSNTQDPMFSYQRLITYDGAGGRVIDRNINTFVSAIDQNCEFCGKLQLENFSVCYVGIEVNKSDGIHYGWLKIKKNYVNNQSIGIEVLSSLYNPVPNEAVTTGVTSR